MRARPICRSRLVRAFVRGPVLRWPKATVLLAALMAKYRFEVMDLPEPVAHLTVRARDGINLRAVPP